MFKLKQNNTTVRTELVAGITTFMAMAYILMVNAGMFSTLGGNALGASYYNAVYIATALSAVFGTLLIGLLSNLPLAQASGMGLNAFFVYSVCIGMGFTYANALVMVLVDGIVFLLLTVTGLRRLIFDAIPKAVKAAIAPGIGLFIAFLGLQNSGIVVNSVQHYLRPHYMGRDNAPAHHHCGSHRNRRNVKEKDQGRSLLGYHRRRSALLCTRPSDDRRILCKQCSEQALSQHHPALP